MTDMTLTDAVAELKRVWKVIVPPSITTVETILNAVASGELIPLADQDDLAEVTRLRAERDALIEAVQANLVRPDYLRAEAAEAEVARQDKVIDAYNGLLRSAFSIAERDGRNTNWGSFHRRVKTGLYQYHGDWLGSKERLDRAALAPPADRKEGVE